MMNFRSRFAAAILSLVLLYLNGAPVATAGTIMPPGETTFFDNNGLPLSAGCVFFYVPGTLSPKTTYQNAAQTISNTNPVQLDAAGRAIIYGTGTYRQIVQQAPCPGGGTQVWDQITADTSSSVTIYAGASSGTPNAITVTAAAFTGTDGQVVNYISTNTNTGAATFNPSSFGAVQIVRDGATGPGALTGGELVATNAVSLIYDATAGTFHILSPVTWPNTSGVPVGAIIPVGGFSPPTNYVFAFGQAVSRTSFSGLLSAYTSAQTGTIASGSPIITGLSDTTQFARGQFVEAVGIPSSTTVLSCTSSTCTLSANATASRTGTMTFFAYGDGDGSTTFNLPDLRGQVMVGRDNMGGTAGNVMQVAATLTTTSGSPTATVSSATNLAAGMSIVGNVNVPSGTTISSIAGTTITMSANATATQATIATRFSPLADAQGLGIGGGTFAKTLQTVEIPAHSHGITDPGHTHGTATSAGGVNTGNAHVGTGINGNVSTGGSAIIGLQSDGTNHFLANATTGITINNAGGGQAYQMVNPMRTVNWAVRLTP